MRPAGRDRADQGQKSVAGRVPFQPSFRIGLRHVALLRGRRLPPTCNVDASYKTECCDSQGCADNHRNTRFHKIEASKQCDRRCKDDSRPDEDRTESDQ